MIFDTIIVGAGLSGTYLSRELRNEGLKTIIVEKSNGVGGRLSTKPLGSNIVDYGCQYINPKNDETKSLAIDLENLGLLKRKIISIYWIVSLQSQTIKALENGQLSQE